MAAVRAAGATKTTTVTAMGGGTNNNQPKAMRGSKRNGVSSGSSDSGEGDVIRDIHQDGNDDSDDADPVALRTPPEAMFAPPSALAE